jgi:hypothetical protein
VPPKTALPPGKRWLPRQQGDLHQHRPPEVLMEDKRGNFRRFGVAEHGAHSTFYNPLTGQEEHPTQGKFRHRD